MIGNYSQFVASKLWQKIVVVLEPLPLFPHFFLLLERFCFGGLGWKTPRDHQLFPFSFPLLMNNGNFSFISTILLFFFHSPTFHFNQTQCKLSQVQSGVVLLVRPLHCGVFLGKFLNLGLKGFIHHMGLVAQPPPPPPPLSHPSPKK